jgi:hypothetical protein
MTKPLQYITITLFALASVFFGCAQTRPANDTTKIPKGAKLFPCSKCPGGYQLIRETPLPYIKKNAKRKPVRHSQTIIINGDNNGEIIQRN